MSVCERCTENGNCAWENHDETICREKPAFPITNADRIRAMTDEELAEVFTDVGVRTLRLHRLPVAEPVIEQAKEDWLDWLRQEVAE